MSYSPGFTEREVAFLKYVIRNAPTTEQILNSGLDYHSILRPEEDREPLVYCSQEGTWRLTELGEAKLEIHRLRHGLSRLRDYITLALQEG